MHKTILLKLLTFVLFATTLLNALPARTWVSGLGNDANPCSRFAPCRTFAGAISKTAAGGEIDVLDPGGYGQVTITKAITIDGGGGQVASILATIGNGILVVAGPNDVVALRNLTINGVGTGVNGVKFTSGKALYIEHCTLANFTNRGIDIEANGGASGNGGNNVKVFVLDTIARNNGESGLRAINTLNTVSVLIDKCRFEGNLDGVWAGDFSNITVRDSDASGNSQNGYVAQGNAGTSDLNLVNSTTANNINAGLYAGGGSVPSTIRISGDSLFNDLTGMFITAGGSILSFGNNYNTAGGAPSGPLPVQ